MKYVPILKYTANGNNFVIVDETQGHVLTETEKSKFAYQATNINYGVGSDNFLLIQPCKPETLHDINSTRHFWDKTPEPKNTDFIFRMFEPDGVEAFCCANGLMCIANYLNHRYDIASARIMTEIPTATPTVISIGTFSNNGTSWANMGYPRRIPLEIVNPSGMIPYDNIIDTVCDLDIIFRRHDLAPFSQEKTLKISGYLVFTGEPHMVIFPDTGFSITELSKLVFITSQKKSSPVQKPEERVAFGSWLVDHIGNYLNREYKHLFPSGINVNFVREDKASGALEYRCFERGIFRETLACGTGALAVSFVARRLNLRNTDQIIVWPHRSRWKDPSAQILVKEDKTGWMLFANPSLLFEGAFLFQTNPNDRKDSSIFKSFLSKLNKQAGERLNGHVAFFYH
jgi:diaminopimelate epimerase